MSKSLIVLFAVLASLATAVAAPRTTPDGKTYAEIVSACAAEWRASETRKTTKKGEGQAAWQTFRKECVEKAGWTSGKRS